MIKREKKKDYQLIEVKYLLIEVMLAVMNLGKKNSLLETVTLKKLKEIN